jgi:hypothetical protein
MRALLANAANPDTLGFSAHGDGKTALQLAEEQGETEIAQLLRDAAANKGRLSTPRKVP